MIQSTRQELLDYIRNATEIYLRTNEMMVSTEEIANHFHLSRSVISRYLNGLFDEKKLIKISTRPVLFFDLQTIEKTYDLSRSGYEFLSLEEFEKVRNNNQINEHFKEIIGKSTSLKDAMNTIKKILNKKTSGVVMITGERGTGKSILSNSLASAYAKQYSTNKTKVVCTKGYQKYSADLFNENGLLTKSEHMVLIDDIDNMPLDDQNEISFRINNELCGTNLIIITATDIHKISESLQDIAKFKIKLPVLSNKTLKEKEWFIYKFLERYNSSEHPVFISNDALNLLCNLETEGNITGLMEIIDEAYTNAKNESVSSVVNLYRYHFPISGSLNTVLSSSKNKVMLAPDDIKEMISFDLVTNTIETIKEQYCKLVKIENRNEDFIHLLINKINSYCDYVLFNKKTSSGRLQIIEKVVENIFQVIEDNYKLSVNYSMVKSFSRILYENTYIDTHIKSWESVNQEFTDEFNNMISSRYAFISEQLDEIENKLESMLEIKIDILSRLYLFINFIEMNKNAEQYGIIGLIAAHGYSTASSIADTANRMIGVHVFDGIDMPIDVQTADIVNRIKEYINLRRVTKEILLLVDMGSLEKIGQEIADATSNRVAVINNISTKIAMVLGMDIVANKSLNEIAENSMLASQFSCHIIENHIKKKAVLFAFEPGIQTTERVMQVFQASLPRSVDIKFIALDYMDTLSTERMNEINEIYHVLFIVGTLNTRINNIPCIALEDIMTGFNRDRFNQLMHLLLNEEDIEIMNDNLIRNFSLENIMRNVTILNPYMLMDLIEEALNMLQREMNVKFSNKVMIGLYLHISSMIERIITKEYEISHSNLDEFKFHHTDFIESFDRAFSKIKAKYNIEISVSEMAYLHDYISNGFIYTKNEEE